MPRRILRAQGARQRERIRALQFAAPEPYRSTLAMADLSLFRKSQLLDTVLREQFILDARGKIVGKRGASVRVIDGDQDPEDWSPDWLPPGRP